MGVSTARMVGQNSRVAVLFPGQGAQYVGMGKELYDTCPPARKVFDQADYILGLDLTRLVFEGPEEKLTSTANSQPAIFAMSFAAWQALKARAGWLHPRAFAGLSLGEYTALVAAGALSFEQGLKLVQKRGEFMEQSCRARPGTMASVIGITIEKVRSVCASAQKFGLVDVANANSPGQVVISGEKQAVQAAAQLALQQGAQKVIPLKVGGAFHSRLMDDAAKRLSSDLRKASVAGATVPVVANFTAREETQPSEIIDNLARQVTGTVLWENSIRHLLNRGVDTFVEVGCGRVLQGLVKRISPETVRLGVQDLASLEATLNTLQQVTQHA